MLEGADDDCIHPALDVVGNIAQRFAVFHAGAGLVHKEGGAAQAGHAGFKGQAGAQGGFFEEQHQLFAGQRRTKISRTVLDDVGEFEERFNLLGRKILHRHQVAAGPRLLQRRA